MQRNEDTLSDNLEYNNWYKSSRVCSLSSLLLPVYLIK